MTGLSLRDLLPRVANELCDENYGASRDALPTATIFVKLVGVPNPTIRGDRYVVPGGRGVQIAYTRLPSGMQLIPAFAARLATHRFRLARRAKACIAHLGATTQPDPGRDGPTGENPRRPRRVYALMTWRR
jgi:hypothetical protein